MRHIGSLLLALVFAPAIFLLTGTGLSAFDSSVAAGAQYLAVGTAGALGALVLAGALYAVLSMSRLSPIGPTVAGLGFLGASGWALFSTDTYNDTFALVDIHMAGAVGLQGLGILLAVPLLATVGSPRRWRRYDGAAVATASAGYPQQQYPQPGYPQPGQPQPPYPAQAHPQQPGSAPNPTRQFTMQPTVLGADLYPQLPDVPAPSLGYPKGVNPVAVPAAPTVAVPRQAPAEPTMALPPAQTAPGPPVAAAASETAASEAEPTMPIATPPVVSAPPVAVAAQVVAARPVVAAPAEPAPLPGLPTQSISPPAPPVPAPVAPANPPVAAEPTSASVLPQLPPLPRRSEAPPGAGIPLAASPPMLPSTIPAIPPLPEPATAAPPPVKPASDESTVVLPEAAEQTIRINPEG